VDGRQKESDFKKEIRRENEEKMDERRESNEV